MTLFKTINAPVLILMAGLFMSAPHALGYTNPIEGGVTETVTNTWVVPSGDLYVGYETPDNSLFMSNGIVHNTHGFIGSHADSSSNTVLLTGSRSIWHNTEGLYLGGHKDGTTWVDGGAGNTLIVYSGVLVGEVETNALSYLSASIVVGDASGTPEMIIANGSTVRSSGDSYIGYGTNESGSVEIRGEGSVWDTRDSPSQVNEQHIGWNGSGNKLTVSDGGLLYTYIAYIGYKASADNNMVLVTGTGSIWEGGSVYVGWSGSGNRLEVSDGGQINCERGALGWRVGSDNNSVLVTGAGSVWRSESSRSDVVVGSRGKGNTLTVNNGGKVFCGRVIAVGRDSGSDNNAVFVSGNGSALSSDRFYLGGQWNVGGRGNGLYVDDGGLVSVGRDMHSRNYSTVSIDDPESQIVIGENYYQDATSTLRFGVTTNATGAFLQVGGTAEFEAGATLQYHSDSNVGMLEFDRFYTNLIVEADQLIVGGVTNAHDLGALEVVNLDSSLVEMALWEQDQDMYGLLSRRHLAESAGFVSGSQMALVSGEIDDLSVLGNTAAVDQINLLNRMSGTQQDAQLTQRYAQGSPSYRHNQTLIGGRNQVCKRVRTLFSSFPGLLLCGFSWS